jgi:hypothetical protein
MYVYRLAVLIFIPMSFGAFWSEIPARCVYNRNELLSCSNTTFTRSIPLFNDFTYTFQHHHVDIRDSRFNLTLYELFHHVASNIQHLTLIHNRIVSTVNNRSERLFFRSLQTLTNHDSQWFQSSSSYYPRLTRIELSFNQLIDEHLSIFQDELFPQLRHVNLSHNRIRTIDYLDETILHRIRSLTLSFNPVESIRTRLRDMRSLQYLDLSSTSIKNIFHLNSLTHLDVFHCRQCHTIPIDNYEQFFTNCSSMNEHLTIDFSQTGILSMKMFNSSIICIKALIVNNQRTFESITSHDLLHSRNLQSIELRNCSTIEYVHLNVYDRLQSIDFSYNQNLNQLVLHLMTNYTYIQRLLVSHALLNDFSLDFLRTTQTLIHIETIDFSYNQLETIQFVHYLIFSTLDVSFNRLKIVDLQQIQYPHGIYNLGLMNLLNLSSNSLESIHINWTNESPHMIDLSSNDLRSIALHGKSTYSLRLNMNPHLSIQLQTLRIDFPVLQYLDLSRIDLMSLKDLTYLYHLTNIQTLILDHNQLRRQDRTLEWHVFFPWHSYLTHLSLQNISLEKIDSNAYLTDYHQLLTIDLYGNTHLPCDCSLKSFIHWLKLPPPSLSDFYQPLEKFLRIDCPTSLFDLHCDNEQQRFTRKSIIIYGLSMFVVLSSVLVVLFYVIKCSNKRYHCQSYRRIFTDSDIIALNERNLNERIDNE